MKHKNDKLTHVDEGGAARMVDVGQKSPTRRAATAVGQIHMRSDTLEAIRTNALEKGDVLTVAKIAGINAGKRAADWIPLCHPLQVDAIDLSMTLDEDIPGVRVQARSAVHARTGAEMEALVAVSAALLTIYDMCKGLDRGMQIAKIRLIEKSGGRGGTWRASDT